MPTCYELWRKMIVVQTPNRQTAPSENPLGRTPRTWLSRPRWFPHAIAAASSVSIPIPLPYPAATFGDKWPHRHAAALLLGSVSC